MSNQEFIFQEIESSNIAAIAYADVGDLDDAIGTLAIRFNSGQTYHYANFPAQMAAEFFNSESKGAFFHSAIKNVYKCVKQEEEPEDEE